jgi:8-oxo-dGTP pyrophosphatase MutT (NUDIX family)
MSDNNNNNSRSPTVRVGGIVLDAADNLLIVFGKNSKKWSVPKGSLEGDETFLKGAIREINEETGIHLQPDTTHHLHYWAVNRARLYLFRVDQVRPNLNPKDTVEVEKAMWLNLDDTNEISLIEDSANKMLSAVITKLRMQLKVEREMSLNY